MVKIKQHHVLPRPVYTNEHTVIPSGSHAKLPIHVNKSLPQDRNFVFEPRYPHLTMFNHKLMTIFRLF